MSARASTVRAIAHRMAGMGLAIVLAIAGCTPIPRMVIRPAAPVSRTDSTRVTPGTHPVTRPGSPVSAVVDSAPSPAALAVLSSIPEPLTPEERVPPPEITPSAPDSSVPAAAPADSEASAPADTTSEVPVPAPTPKLGDIVNPGLDPAHDSGATPADSVGAAPALPKAPASAPPPAAPAAPAPAAGCWRVQLMAPREKAEANRKRSAAESILLLPMVIEREAGLYKIRTRECFSRATADVVRGRAVSSGFAGAFPFESVKR